MENVLTGKRSTPADATASTQHIFPSIDEEVVGFDDDAESIIQKLTGRIEELDIVSIVGMPGLGKTTFAIKVFTHHSIDKHFDVRTWCSISKEYNLMKVFSEILKQVVGSMDGIKDEDMPDKLRKSLIILLTTRDEVARQLKHHSDPYFLRFLTVDESSESLQKKVFQGEIFPPELLEAGQRVAKNCKGLPLVIVLIAGIIAEERQASLWLEVANDLSSHVLEEQSMKIIESSYDPLQDHLNSCLLYIVLFPEDYDFPVREDNGEIAYFPVHDVVREFCLRKLTKEKFMQYQQSKEPHLIRCIHDDLVHQLLQYEQLLDNIPMLAYLKEGESVAQCHDSASSNSLEVVGKDEFSRRFETSPFIWKMQKLRHVDIQVFSFKWEDNDRAVFEESSETVLGNLKTFGKCRIYLADMAPEFWRRFPNIEQLNLHFVEPGYEVDMPNLEELPLQSLEVGFSRPILGYNPIGRDSCVVFPSNLKDLPLDRLCDVSDYEFRALKYLNLKNVLVTEWRSSEASFPVLEKLIISNCRILCGQIPSSFVDISTLKLIILICCDDSLEDSALNIKKEVEEMTGCDSLQVHMLYKTYEAADVSFAIDSFSAWDSVFGIKKTSVTHCLFMA
ncbi:hypothetical protein RND71_039974 [Anisodus tanguticus]|uniref:NB-ARC domain-containing protein n=1 Tax=Anisodus tanguticus TaxID=243964 RepID=A0AAE1QXS8_9SOLA|nr:hypothetical protein RND71_039974 [Anisodus tanguticus]